MEEGSRDTQRKRELTEELIEEVDLLADSPRVRAEQIWMYIKATRPEWTDWDLLCFCTEFMGLISPRFPWLTSNAKQVARLVYSAHYFYPENVNAKLGDPDSRIQHRTKPGGNSA